MSLAKNLGIVVTKTKRRIAVITQPTAKVATLMAMVAVAYDFFRFCWVVHRPSHMVGLGRPASASSSVRSLRVAFLLVLTLFFLRVLLFKPSPRFWRGEREHPGRAR